MPVRREKCCPAPAGRPSQRTPSTRSTCPCAKSAQSPAARTRAITRSTRSPTCSGASPPGHPSLKINQPGAISSICLGVSPSYLPVIPLYKVAVDYRPVAETCEVTGLPCPLHRADQNKGECLLRQHRRSRSARRRPLSVSGMSVAPVCWPLRLQAVSPCLIANTFTLASSRSSDVICLRRTHTSGCCLLPP